MDSALSSSRSNSSVLLLKLLGLIAGVMMWVVLDVQISLAKIVENDPATWPNMAPQTRYIFIPLFSVIAVLFGLPIDWIVRRVLRRREFHSRWQLVTLGACFGLVAVPLWVIRVIEHATPSLLLLGPLLAGISIYGFRSVSK